MTAIEAMKILCNKTPYALFEKFGISKFSNRCIYPKFALSRTYVYVLVGLTGRAQDICVVRVSFQLSSELLFTAVYPRTGGVSGNCSRNLPKPILKLSRSLICDTSEGKIFQS